MRQKRSFSAYGTAIKWKRIFRNVLAGAVILVLLSLIPLIYVKLKGQNGHEQRELRELYDSGAFETVYSQSSDLLKEKPLDPFLLTINGFSAYELAIAQINSFDTISYVDSCIWSLRKTMLFRENSSDGRVFYVLGKAYYYKGPGYADLAINYLEKALAAAYKAADIPEYLGLAYAAIRDFRSSVAAFTLALNGEGPSDILLISIARSYLALDEYESGRAYLIRCLETSKDFKVITAARLLLGEILFKTGDFEAAEAEYLQVIEETGGDAEAYFQLGELYASMGNTTRARSEWRRAIRLDPAHRLARSRLQ